MKSLRLFVAVFVAALVLGCATTPFRDIPVEKLSDQQLVDELAAASEGVGRQLNKADYLLATKPDPLYLLSSSTSTYFGTSDVAVSGYLAPAGRYGQSFYASGVGTYAGAAQTRYYYTDVNALAETAHLLGAAIAQGKAEANRRRGLEVLAELRRRADVRRAATQQPLDKFFAQDPALSQDKALITSVLAWVPASVDAPGSELHQAKATIDAMQRGPGLGGDWYGIFVQRTTLPDGRSSAMNNFVRLKLAQGGDRVTGSGELGTGEQIEVDCRVIGDEIKGTVTNRTFAIVVSVSGNKKERDRLSLEFSGTRAQVQRGGQVALFR